MSPRAEPPRRPELPDGLQHATLEELSHDATLTEIELEDAALADQNARGVTVQTARLTRVDLGGSRLEHLRIGDALLSACNLANVHARGAHVKGVVVQGSRLTGMALAQGRLTDVVFQGCRIDLASYRPSGRGEPARRGDGVAGHPGHGRRVGGGAGNRGPGRRVTGSVLQLDDERDAGVEPVAVQLLDLRARGQPAQVQVALAVVEQRDGVAHRAPGLLELSWIGDLACDSRELPPRMRRRTCGLARMFHTHPAAALGRSSASWGGRSCTR